jgi:hypothetical protein
MKRPNHWPRLEAVASRSTISKAQIPAFSAPISIIINDLEGSNTRFLSTDINNTEVSIYDIDSHQGLAGEIDTRLFTESGRDQIAEDWLKTGMIANTIELIVANNTVGLGDFFDETKKHHDSYQALKQAVATNPVLAEALQNTNLSADQKEQMANQLTAAVMVRLGYGEYQNNIIATDEPGRDGVPVYGYYSTDTGEAYLNDQHLNDTQTMVTAIGHEATRAMDHQDRVNFDQNRLDRVHYAKNYGENFASYTDQALDINGYDQGMAKTNHHVDNDGTLVQHNNRIFAGLDKTKGDNYLNHEQQLRYNRLINVLFDCDSAGGCTQQQIEEIQPQVVDLLRQDHEADARLEAACHRSNSSAACRAEAMHLKKALESYQNLTDPSLIFEDGTVAGYQKVATLYGTHRSEALSDNAKRALVDVPIDAVTGTVDFSKIVLKAAGGNDEAQMQLGVLSGQILALVTDPRGAIEQGIKFQLEEADRQEALGNINQAEQIRSKVVLEGAFAIVGTGSGAFALVRTGMGIPDAVIRTAKSNNSSPPGGSESIIYKKLVGEGALNEGSSQLPLVDVDAEAGKNSPLIEDSSPFITNGLNPNSPGLEQVREEIVKEYLEANLSEKLARDLADGNISSSKTIPIKRIAFEGEELYKFVPSGKGIGNSSYYFTKEEYEFFIKNPEKLASKSGLPYSNFVGNYNIYMIKPRRDKSPIVFESEVADVNQGGYNAGGGASQTIVPNLKNWTKPEVIESIKVY